MGRRSLVIPLSTASSTFKLMAFYDALHKEEKEDHRDYGAMFCGLIVWNNKHYLLLQTDGSPKLRYWQMYGDYLHLEEMKTTRKGEIVGARYLTKKEILTVAPDVKDFVEALNGGLSIEDDPWGFIKYIWEVERFKPAKSIMEPRAYVRLGKDFSRMEVIMKALGSTSRIRSYVHNILYKDEVFYLVLSFHENDVPKLLQPELVDPPVDAKDLDMKELFNLVGKSLLHCTESLMMLSFGDVPLERAAK